MPAKDLYHDACVHALQKDGWTVTHDPLSIPIEDTTILIDLGAERLITAERQNEQIAIKSNRLSGFRQYKI